LLAELSDKVICHIWQRMATIYGYKWASHMGMADDGTGILTDAANTWKKGLAGITVEKIKYGFDVLIFKKHEWPPSLPEFRSICIAQGFDSIPSVDEVISILVRVSGKQGSLADRYENPLIFAVAQKIDMHGLRTAKTVDAKRMIKPVYEKLLETGWKEWPEHAFVEQKALSSSKERNRSAGISALRLIKGSL
jgi:hypothetical protein